MNRLKATEVKPYREALLREQGGNCALCGLPIAAGEAVLDHCHKTGYVRGVLHRGCNAMAGHVENNMPRHKLTSIPKLVRFCRNLPSYITGHYEHRPLHPTFRTEEEKRLRRNAQARKRRAKGKV